MTPRQHIDTLLFACALTLLSAPAIATPKLELVLEGSCRALALDREPYVAALGADAVTVLDKQGKHRESLPASLLGKEAKLGLFFGRDFRVRLAGTARTPKGDEVAYYRSVRGALAPALDELGPLGRPGAPGLVALLGTADPEIVCRPGQACLLKRVSGWTRASSPANLALVGLSRGEGWAIAGRQFFRLERDFTPLGPSGPWRTATDAFVRGQEACVVEHDQSLLHHFDGHTWHSAPAPLSGPRTVWATEGAFWIGGDGGVARYVDGIFEKPSEQLHVAQVLGRGADDVWVCAQEGLFRARPAAPG